MRICLSNSSDSGGDSEGGSDGGSGGKDGQISAEIEQDIVTMAEDMDAPDAVDDQDINEYDDIEHQEMNAMYDDIDHLRDTGTKLLHIVRMYLGELKERVFVPRLIFRQLLILYFKMCSKYWLEISFGQIDVP